MREKTERQREWESWMERSMSDIKTGGENRLNQMLDPKLVECCAEEQSVILRFEIFPWELNPRGELHGGSIASMFDVALGLTARCASRSLQVATTDISISYLRRVEADDTIFIHTKVQKSGRLMTRTTAEARSGKSGKVVATAQSSFMVLNNMEATVR